MHQHDHHRRVLFGVAVGARHRSENITSQPLTSNTSTFSGLPWPLPKQQLPTHFSEVCCMMRLHNLDRVLALWSLPFWRSFWRVLFVLFVAGELIDLWLSLIVQSTQWPQSARKNIFTCKRFSHISVCSCFWFFGSTSMYIIVEDLHQYLNIISILCSNSDA